MLRAWVLIVIGLITVFLAGCAATNTESSREHTHRIKRNMDKDMKNIADDWDRIWMADKPSRGTPNNM